MFFFFFFEKEALMFLFSSDCFSLEMSHFNFFY
jgi:hypothetical protein